MKSAYDLIDRCTPNTLSPSNPNPSRHHKALLILPNRPTLLRLRTKLLRRDNPLPILGSLNHPHLPVRLPLIPPKQRMPALQPLLHPLPRLRQLLLPPLPHLLLAQLAPGLCLLDDFRGRVGLFFRVDGHEHELHAAQVRVRVFGEAAREEGARGVAAREEVVASAGAVGLRGGADVVDCAVEGEVDGELWVGAVVGGELHVGEVDLGFLQTRPG